MRATRESCHTCSLVAADGLLEVAVGFTGSCPPSQQVHVIAAQHPAFELCHVSSLPQHARHLQQQHGISVGKLCHVGYMQAGRLPHAAA